MNAVKSKIWRVVLSLLFILALIFSAYIYARSKFIQKTNALLDPSEKAFSGMFIPWPIGSPTLYGNFDPETDSRIRASIGYTSGGISTNGMTLIMYDSDGSFLVRAN